MYVFKNLSSLDKLPDELREYIFEKIFEEAEMAKFTDIEYMQYAENLKIYRDNYNCAEFAMNKAIKEGHRKGIEKGRKEERETLVINSAHAGLPVGTIAAITELPVEEIKMILEKQKP